MKKKPVVSIRCMFAALGLWACGTMTVRSDTLTLRNGKTMQGGFVSSDGHTISFATLQGVQSYSRSEVASLTFADADEKAAPPAAAAAAPEKKEPPAGSYTLPAGTLLIVSMQEEVTSQEPAGRGFKAKLEADLTVGGTTVVPAGTEIFGKITESMQARRMVGRSVLELALTGIKIDGVMHPITTGNFAESGPSSLRKVARNAAVGAAIGSASGGHEDAEKGATYGAAASVLTRGKSIVVPAGAMLDFHMQQPLTITVKP